MLPTDFRPVIDSLTRARDLIAEPGGWTTGHYQSGDAYCAVGALRVVTLGSAYTRSMTLIRDMRPDMRPIQTFNLAYQALSVMTARITGRPYHPGSLLIENFNDHDAHCKAAVIHLYDVTIGELRRLETATLSPPVKAAVTDTDLALSGD